MKEKEKWAQDYVTSQIYDIANPLIKIYAHRDWLAGFEFAKRKIMENCGSPDSPAWIGEDEI